jgi:hypothetical protein
MGRATHKLRPERRAQVAGKLRVGVRIVNECVHDGRRNLRKDGRRNLRRDPARNLKKTKTLKLDSPRGECHLR